MTHNDPICILRCGTELIRVVVVRNREVGWKIVLCVRTLPCTCSCGFLPTVERATAVINGPQPPPLPKRYICLLSELLLWEPAIWAQASCSSWMITLVLGSVNSGKTFPNLVVFYFFINQPMGIFSLNDSNTTFISSNIWPICCPKCEGPKQQFLET